jgi:hypothetical protein
VIGLDGAAGTGVINASILTVPEVAELPPDPAIWDAAGTPGDYAPGLQVAGGLFSEILWVDEGTGALRRFVVGNVPADPARQAAGAARLDAPTGAASHDG